MAVHETDPLAFEAMMLRPGDAEYVVRRCHDVASLVGVAAPEVEVSETRGGLGQTRFSLGAPRIRVCRPYVDGVPAHVLDFVVAHEVGHIRAGHQRPRGNLGLLAWFAAVCVVFVAGLVCLPPLWSVVLDVVVVAVTVVAGHSVARRRELVADRLAMTTPGWTPTWELLAYLTALAGVGRQRGPAWLRPHPPWSSRVERMRQVLGDRLVHYGDAAQPGTSGRR